MTFFAVIALFFSMNRAQANEANSAIRLLLPTRTFAEESQTVFNSIIKKYNDEHSDSKQTEVTILWRGNEFSSLRELIAMHLAGDPPEMAAIECSELPAVQATQLLKPIKGASFNAFSRDSLALSFELTQPVLFYAKTIGRPPGTWNTLVDLSKKLARDSSKGEYALAIPLQGERGLWIFEALAGKPLWTRETGGLKSNRSLEEPIRTLQNLIDTPSLVRTDETWDRAVQSFVDRKTPLLVGSLDLIPYLTKNANFPWSVSPLPKPAAALEGGSCLIVTKDSPTVWKFLEFLYSKPIIKRWAPPKAPKKGQQITKRSTDIDVVRARSEWIQALHLLFGESAKRLPAESALTQLDRFLSAK